MDPVSIPLVFLRLSKWAGRPIFSKHLINMDYPLNLDSNSETQETYQTQVIPTNYIHSRCGKKITPHLTALTQSRLFPFNYENPPASSSTSSSSSPLPSQDHDWSQFAPSTDFELQVQLQTTDHQYQPYAEHDHAPRDILFPLPTHLQMFERTLTQTQTRTPVAGTFGNGFTEHQYQSNENEQHPGMYSRLPFEYFTN